MIRRIKLSYFSNNQDSKPKPKCQLSIYNQRRDDRKVRWSITAQVMGALKLEELLSQDHNQKVFGKEYYKYVNDKAKELRCDHGGLFRHHLIQKEKGRNYISNLALLLNDEYAYLIGTPNDPELQLGWYYDSSSNRYSLWNVHDTNTLPNILNQMDQIL